jgi:hypothetical protein
MVAQPRSMLAAPAPQVSAVELGPEAVVAVADDVAAGEAAADEAVADELEQAEAEASAPALSVALDADSVAEASVAFKQVEGLAPLAPEVALDLPAEQSVVDDLPSPIASVVDALQPVLGAVLAGITLPTPLSNEPVAPMGPITPAPGSIGLSSAASSAGWLPSCTSLLLLAMWHTVWRHKRRLPSVIVLPNLAPPG